MRTTPLCISVAIPGLALLCLVGCAKGNEQAQSEAPAPFSHTDKKGNIRTIKRADISCEETTRAGQVYCRASGEVKSLSGGRYTNSWGSHCSVAKQTYMKPVICEAAEKFKLY